jgi:hypothetical protein
MGVPSGKRTTSSDAGSSQLHNPTADAGRPHKGYSHLFPAIKLTSRPPSPQEESKEVQLMDTWTQETG